MSEKNMRRAAEQIVPCDGPFSVPDGWAWVRMADAATLLRGIAERPDRHSDKLCFCEHALPPELSPDAFCDARKFKYIPREAMPETVQERCCPVLFAVGAHAGEILLLASWESELPYGFIALMPEAFLDERYLFYAMQSDVIKEQLMQRRSARTSSISARMLSEIRIPVAPLMVQKEIVKRLDSILGKLGRAEANARTVMDSRHARFMSVLERVFPSVGKSSAYAADGRWLRLSDVCEMTTGITGRAEKSGTIPMLRPNCIQALSLHIPDDSFAAEPDEKYLLRNGDVLVSRVGPREQVGKTAVFRGDAPAAFDSSLIRVRSGSSDVLGEYLGYALQAPRARRYFQERSAPRAAGCMLTHDAIGDFSLFIPSAGSQRQIVSALDHIQEKEQQVTALASEFLVRCRETRAAVLGRVFRGEIAVREGNTDAPAAALVKRAAASPKRAGGRAALRIPPQIREQLHSAVEEKIVRLLLAKEGQAAALDEILTVQKDKLAVLDALHSLTERGILQRINDVQYRIGA